MELKVLEKKKNKLVVEVAGETHTLLNLLRENAWKAGAGQASYTIQHPYLSEPQITMIAENPKGVLSKAAKLSAEQVSDFERKFKAASRRK